MLHQVNAVSFSHLKPARNCEKRSTLSRNGNAPSAADGAPFTSISGISRRSSLRAHPEDLQGRPEASVAGQGASGSWQTEWGTPTAKRDRFEVSKSLPNLATQHPIPITVIDNYSSMIFSSLKLAPWQFWMPEWRWSSSSWSILKCPTFTKPL